MDSALCPKCGGPFDEGRASATSGSFVYRSSRQPPSGKTTNFQAARVCLDCGYMEFYLPVEELRSKLLSGASPDTAR
jgi:hypothetical protein